jgi:hypothetical protein
MDQKVQEWRKLQLNISQATSWAGPSLVPAACHGSARDGALRICLYDEPAPLRNP